MRGQATKVTVEVGVQVEPPISRQKLDQALATAQHEKTQSSINKYRSSSDVGNVSVENHQYESDRNKQMKVRYKKQNKAGWENRMDYNQLN